jgi:type IV pilus assembly protein PilB
MKKPVKNKKNAPRRKKIGECLVEAGLIDQKTLNKALDLQKIEKKRIGQVLIDMGVADDIVIARALSKQLNIPFLKLKEKKVSKDIISLVPAELAENHLLLPLKVVKEKLVVAMANPLDFYALDDLRFVTQRAIHIAVASHGDILDAIERHYPKHVLEKAFESGPGMENGVEVIQRVETEEKDASRLLTLAELPPVVRLGNAILSDAIKLEASDIHIEPQKAAVVIRYRIDGVMREIMKTDKHVHASLVSRIKIISGMDISQRRIPQDGRSQIRYNGKNYDLRVSTLPTSYGEKVTIRILNPDIGSVRLEDLGFNEKALEDFLGAVGRPQGMILVTGPTGSGKSSTLYACLNRLNTPAVNIITVEDPVEYDVEGINQVQINPKAGITFAAGLKSILRQDPDIVMVGEIRDSETAPIAFQAAQTGHLVLSTLHTNDALSTVTRLLDLGIEPFLVSASLAAVVGQRLVRKICRDCIVPEPLSSGFLERLPLQGNEGKDAKFWKGAGCKACNYTGYAGRLALFEVLKITPSLKKLIAINAPNAELKEAAQKDGFQTLSMDGVNKALQGLTTIEEVFRVAPPEVEDVANAAIIEPSMDAEIYLEEPMPVAPAAALSPVKPQKILLTDDNEIMLKILHNILESENYLTLTAKNGVDALKLAVQEKPDLIITDYLMPEMDGISLIKKLKSQLATRYMPIIMLTAKDDLDSEVQGIDAGADDYLSKPVNARKLLARVNRILRRPPAFKIKEEEAHDGMCFSPE